MSHEPQGSSGLSRTGLGAGLAIALAGAPLSADLPRYTVRDVGTVAGSTVCVCFFGRRLNDSGQAAVRFFSSAGHYATMFHDGQTNINIGTLGGDAALPRAINNHGAIVGFSDTSGNPQRAFLWHEGVFTDLGSLAQPSREGHSDAHDINDAMQVVGSAQDRDGHSRPFLWSPSAGMIDLGTFGGVFGDALAINESGTVVGWAWDAARDRRPFVWTEAGGMVDLGDLGFDNAAATGINQSGLIVGSAGIGALPSGSTQFRAVLWTGPGQITNLGTLPNHGVSGMFGLELVTSTAADINDGGQIIGNSYPATVLGGGWVYENGEMISLTEATDDRNWRISEVSDINERGQIIGTGRYGGGDWRAVILTPIPCPPDLTGDAQLDIFDFLRFQDMFLAGDPLADCDQSTGIGAFDIFDFLCFQNAFTAGCD